MILSVNRKPCPTVISCYNTTNVSNEAKILYFYPSPAELVREIPNHNVCIIAKILIRIQKYFDVVDILQPKDLEKSVPAGFPRRIIAPSTFIKKLKTVVFYIFMRLRSITCHNTINKKCKKNVFYTMFILYQTGFIRHSVNSLIFKGL